MHLKVRRLNCHHKWNQAEHSDARLLFFFKKKGIACSLMTCCETVTQSEVMMELITLLKERAAIISPFSTKSCICETDVTLTSAAQLHPRTNGADVLKEPSSQTNNTETETNGNVWILFA